MDLWLDKFDSATSLA